MARTIRIKLADILYNVAYAAVLTTKQSNEQLKITEIYSDKEQAELMATAGGCIRLIIEKQLDVKVIILK